MCEGELGGGGGVRDGTNRYTQHVRSFIAVTKRGAALLLLWVMSF